MNLRIAKKIIKNLEDPKFNMRGEPKLRHNKDQIARAKKILAKRKKKNEPKWLLEWRQKLTEGNPPTGCDYGIGG